MHLDPSTDDHDGPSPTAGSTGRWLASVLTLVPSVLVSAAILAPQSLAVPIVLIAICGVAWFLAVIGLGLVEARRVGRPAPRRRATAGPRHAAVR